MKVVITSYLKGSFTLTFSHPPINPNITKYWTHHKYFLEIFNISLFLSYGIHKICIIVEWDNNDGSLLEKVYGDCFEVVIEEYIYVFEKIFMIKSQ